MNRKRTVSLAFLTGFILCGTGRAADEPVDYVRTIKPLLTRSCIGCHGPDKHRGGLRLDTAASARAGGDSGPAILPGNAKGSRLVRAIRGEPGVEAMPPKPPRLTVAEIDVIRRWIDQGAISPTVESAS